MGELNGGQVIAKQLKAARIDTIFGVVAGPMIEVMAAAQVEGIRVVNCRHEVSAGFAASAYGWIKKQPGVMVVGSGPALTNAVTPLYVATASGMPLVCLGGSAASFQRGLGGFQETDQVAFATPGTKWSVQVDSAERIPEYVHLGLGRALAGRPGGVYLDFPGQLIGGARLPEERLRLREHSPRITAAFPDPAGVATIADMLAGAERPLILVGKGAGWADAGSALTRLVDLGIPFVASPMGRGTVPDDHPLCMNGARSAALAGADAVLMVGGRFNWIFQFGRGRRFAPGARLAHIDVEPSEFISAPDLEIGLTADAAVASEQLAAALSGRTLKSASTGWRDQLAADAAKNEGLIAGDMSSDQQPINHYRLLRELRDLLPRESTLTVDGELTMGVSRIVMQSYGARRILNAGTTGCMGTGLPYAIGAKLARPDEPAVALLGDYAFGAAAMEVETAARIGAKVVIVVANNQGIAGHSIQDRLFAPDAPPIAALLPAQYEKMVDMVGGFTRRVEHPADIRPALEAALAADRLALVHVMTDPKGSARGSTYLA
ncbi:MAG: thiamine pyrophosphate-binding protein [Dehalococcoidia bacterium]|nr:thiamine pyrophosphate-binding protein [Dehalococcoidia bacterium]